MMHLSPFLYIGIMFAFFQHKGKVPPFKQLLEIIINGFTIETSHIFNIRTEIPSWPCDLLISKERIRFSNLFSFKQIEENEQKNGGMFIGRILLFFIGEH